MDAFSSKFVQDLFRDKVVVVIGDSNHRAIYKDFVKLLQCDDLLELSQLKKKGEKSFLNDKLREGGQLGEMNNKTSYKEAREYRTEHHVVRFYFVTRCFGDRIENILSDMTQTSDSEPDLVIMNSCVWDVARYGPFISALRAYKLNLDKLCLRLKSTLPPNCLFLWNTALPVARHIKGGLLNEAIRWMEEDLASWVKEANRDAEEVMQRHGMEVNDLHYYFREPEKQIAFRVNDGLHWDCFGLRFVTELILHHVCRVWKVQVFKKPCEACELWGNGRGQIDGTKEKENTEKSSLTPKSKYRRHRRGHSCMTKVTGLQLTLKRLNNTSRKRASTRSGDDIHSQYLANGNSSPVARYPQPVARNPIRALGRIPLQSVQLDCHEPSPNQYSFQPAEIQVSKQTYASRYSGHPSLNQLSFQSAENQFPPPPTRNEFPPQSAGNQFSPPTRHQFPPQSAGNQFSPPTRHQFPPQSEGNQFSSPPTRNQFSPHSAENEFSSQPAWNEFSPQPTRNQFAPQSEGNQISSPPTRNQFSPQSAENQFSSQPAWNEFSPQPTRNQLAPQSEGNQFSSPDHRAVYDILGELQCAHDDLLELMNLFAPQSEGNQVSSPSTRNKFASQPTRTQFSPQPTRNQFSPQPTRNQFSPQPAGNQFFPQSAGNQFSSQPIRSQFPQSARNRFSQSTRNQYSPQSTRNHFYQNSRRMQVSLQSRRNQASPQSPTNHLESWEPYENNDLRGAARLSRFSHNNPDMPGYNRIGRRGRAHWQE